MKNTGIIEYKEQKWYKKILAKIKNFFGKKKDADAKFNQNRESVCKNKEDKNFVESIKVENDDRIFNLQIKLKANEIKIKDLTNKDLKEMIELYKNQIEAKKIKLKMYRNRMILNKKEE